MKFQIYVLLSSVLMVSLQAYSADQACPAIDTQGRVIRVGKDIPRAASVRAFEATARAGRVEKLTDLLGIARVEQAIQVVSETQLTVAQVDDDSCFNHLKATLFSICTRNILGSSQVQCQDICEQTTQSDDCR